MPIRLRRRFFYVLIVVFLLLGTGAVFYAQGWRASFDPFGLGKVGGVYIRTFPNETLLTLNGEPASRRPGLFDRGVLLSNLLPGTYVVGASAPGYQDWNRQVRVESTFVTRIENVALVPSSGTMATSGPIRYLAAAGNALILSTDAALWTLSGTPLPGIYVEVVSADGSVAITLLADRRRFAAVNLVQGTSTVIRNFTAPRASSYSFTPIPGANNLFLAFGANVLGILDAATGVVGPSLSSSTYRVAAAEGRAVWTEHDFSTNTTHFSYYDLSSRTASRNVDSIPGFVDGMVLRGQTDLFALTNDGSLYRVGLGRGDRTRIAQNVRSILLSPDGSKLAALDAQGVTVFHLTAERPQTALPVPDASQIRRLSWYRDNEHLFVEYRGRVAFLELDDPQLQNFLTAAVIADGTSPAYVPDTNILYYIKDGAVFQAAFPGA